MDFPFNIEDAVGLVIVLRDDVSIPTRNMFGSGEYVLDVSKTLPEVKPEDKIRMFPIEEYPNGRVHMIGSIMGYDMIKKRFKIVRKL